MPDPRIVPGDDECRSSTSALTNLYSRRPISLDLAHKKLDAVVFADYG
jgi:hypothetical protein